MQNQPGGINYSQGSCWLLSHPGRRRPFHRVGNVPWTEKCHWRECFQSVAGVSCPHLLLFGLEPIHPWGKIAPWIKAKLGSGGKRASEEQTFTLPFPKVFPKHLRVSWCSWVYHMGSFFLACRLFFTLLKFAYFREWDLLLLLEGKMVWTWERSRDPWQCFHSLSGTDSHPCPQAQHSVFPSIKRDNNSALTEIPWE